MASGSHTHHGSAPSEPVTQPTSIWQYVSSDHIRTGHASPSRQALPIGTLWQPQRARVLSGPWTSVTYPATPHSHLEPRLTDPGEGIPIVWRVAAASADYMPQRVASRLCQTPPDYRSHSGPRPTGLCACHRRRYTVRHPRKITILGPRNPHARLMPVCALSREPVTGVTGSPRPLDRALFRPYTWGSEVRDALVRYRD